MTDDYDFWPDRCPAMEPPRHPDNDMLSTDVPRNTTYILNPQWMWVSRRCSLQPDHAGPHRWDQM